MYGLDKFDLVECCFIS